MNGAVHGPVSITVVIPVLDDHAALERLLPRLHQLDPPATEIIVVDAGDGRGCERLCTQFGARHLRSVPGRGQQLRVGAAVAQGDVLWFLHADVEPPVHALAAIGRACAGGATGGCFRFRFSGPPTLLRRVLAVLIDLRGRIGVPYGDQGLFATRSAYAASGGFAAQPLFEEVALVRGLRRAGRFVMLPESIGISPRRWERDGWVRRTLANRLLAIGYALGVSPERLARYYRAMGQRERIAGRSGHRGRSGQTGQTGR